MVFALLWRFSNYNFNFTTEQWTLLLRLHTYLTQLGRTYPHRPYLSLTVSSFTPHSLASSLITYIRFFFHLPPSSIYPYSYFTRYLVTILCLSTRPSRIDLSLSLSHFFTSIFELLQNFLLNVHFRFYPPWSHRTKKLSETTTYSRIEITYESLKRLLSEPPKPQYWTDARDHRTTN